jgi:hypothetical protein
MSVRKPHANRSRTLTAPGVSIKMHQPNRSRRSDKDSDRWTSKDDAWGRQLVDKRIAAV